MLEKARGSLSMCGGALFAAHSSEGADDRTESRGPSAGTLVSVYRLEQGLADLYNLRGTRLSGRGGRRGPSF
jgi:hypothetical protein